MKRDQYLIMAFCLILASDRPTWQAASRTTACEQKVVFLFVGIFAFIVGSVEFVQLSDVIKSVEWERIANVVKDRNRR